VARKSARNGDEAISGGEKAIMPTRDRIMKAAAKLFSEKGYNKVTTREIAAAAGINSASIYNHFSSKDELLKSLYNYYTEHRSEQNPDVSELLKLAETAPPMEVLMNAEYHYSEEARGMMDQILVTASKEITSDPDSERFIRENIFDNIVSVLRPVLERLVELEKIKPFDMDAFFNVLCFYCYSAAALNSTPFGHNVREYQASMAFIFSIIARDN